MLRRNLQNALALFLFTVVQFGQQVQADGLESIAQNSLVLTPVGEQTSEELIHYFSTPQAEARIAEAVRFLASDDLKGRGLGKSGLATAAQYISNAFANSGLRTSFYDQLPYQYFPVENMTALGSTANNALQITSASTQVTGLAIEEDYCP